MPAYGVVVGGGRLFDKNKKGRVVDMKKRRKITILALIVCIAAGFTGWICYVNSGIFPSTKIYMIAQGEWMENTTTKVRVNKATLYSKEQWESYIKSQGIKKESQFAEENKDMGYSMSYSEDNYYILVADIDICNTKEEEQKILPESCITLTNGIYSRGIYKDTYYSSVLQGGNGKSVYRIDLKPNEEAAAKCVYVFEKLPKEFALEHLSLGRNQRMKLTVERTGEINEG